MPEKHWLNLIIAFAFLLFTIWLNMATRAWDFGGQLLQALAIAIVTWTLLERGNQKPIALFEFTAKSFVISFAAANIIWFTSLGFLSPWFFRIIDALGITYILMYIILPRALLPLAISIIIYGVLRTKLRPWQILLATWYTSIYAVSTAYTIWWTVFILPYLEHIYISGGGVIARDMLLTVLALIPATISSIIYLTLKKTKMEPPPPL